jgi:hypothetical protein
MSKDSIYQQHGTIESNIRKSYTGGSVDVYIPSNTISSNIFSNNLLNFDTSMNQFLNENVINNEYETLYHYDVNGLYPYVMANFPMPIGKPKPFTGDITKVIPDAFGHFYCKITSPKYLEHPILQRKVNTINGLRTVAGLGTWVDWIFSQEMYNAIKFGYKFEIIKGYEFEKGFIFNKFVAKMYDLRLHYIKGDPMNDIAKLLQNSLYGKFGMKDELTKLEIFNNSDKEFIQEIIELYNTSIKDILELENHTLIIRDCLADYSYNDKSEIYHGSEINVSIASAITAYARIHMSQFKNNPDFKLYYTDTDSIIINKPLPKDMIGNKLGQMKLENVITKAVFIAPKVYSLINENGKVIIKAKGLKTEVIDNLNFNDFENLLIKDSSREFNQEKWHKHLLEGSITTNDVLYTLKSTSSKRESVYINNVYSNTKPFHYNEIISKKEL